MMEVRPQASLVWLSACYFFFFAILGIMVPYLGVFFDDRGFNPQQIGFLLAIVMGTRIIAPNVWARVADKTGMRAQLIKMGALVAAFSYTSFFMTVHLPIWPLAWPSIPSFGMPF